MWQYFIVEDHGPLYETLEMTLGPRELQIPVGRTAEFHCSATSSGEIHSFDAVNLVYYLLIYVKMFEKLLTCLCTYVLLLFFIFFTFDSIDPDGLKA